ncbi:MAG: hypothetical protein OEZ06_00735 [Myxococcales bacterium]|nr:hypothetical protein [Myxococcales bacterium]
MNGVFGRWRTGGKEPNDSVKLTYAFLVTQTRPGQRWIIKPASLLADERGVTLKAFREHCRRLVEEGMILRMLLRDLTPLRCGNEYAICILDLPPWFTGYAPHRSGTPRVASRPPDDDDDEPPPDDDDDDDDEPPPDDDDDDEFVDPNEPDDDEIDFDDCVAEMERRQAKARRRRQ